MSSAFIISLVIQVLLIIHCIRSGRNTLWIWAIALLPLAGPVAYVLVEILPALFRGRGTRLAVRGMRKALDPEQDLRRFELEARTTGDVASRQRYADELTRQGRPADAITVYSQALTGLYESDPNLMLGLAQAQFAAGAFADARATLDALIARNPNFRSPAGHLLYARALEGEGNRAKALEEYTELSKYYAGAEAPLRYAQLLRACGRTEEARVVLKELLEHARLAPRHYRRMQQEWLTIAERELATL
ncbi:MAG TPA: tetratricopeptide repeat protein [Steroidobacteraceae bacterium]